jgi:hypothetical protein
LRSLETLSELSAAAAGPLIPKPREWLEADRPPRGIGLADSVVADDERLLALCRGLLGRL